MTLESDGQYLQPSEQTQTYPGEGEDIHMVAQPETQPINPEQLMAEVKGILAGLLMVEVQYSEVRAQQTASYHDGYQPKLNNEQLQALIALHRTLSHENHGSLASQHPSASASLRRSAPKYPVSTRMRCRQRGPRNQGRCWGRSHSRKTNRGRKWHYGR